MDGMPLGIKDEKKRDEVKVEWFLIVAQFAVSCGKVDK